MRQFNNKFSINEGRIEKKRKEKKKEKKQEELEKTKNSINQRNASTRHRCTHSLRGNKQANIKISRGWNNKREEREEGRGEKVERDLSYVYSHGIHGSNKNRVRNMKAREEVTVFHVRGEE